MINKITNLILILFLVGLNILFFHKTLELSRIYPFKRLPIENILIYDINSADDDLEYKSEIIGIEGEIVKKTNLFELLMRFRNKKELNVEYKHEGKLFRKKIIKEDINKGLLWLIIFMLLLANIHFIWGYFIRLFHPHLNQTKVYFYFSFCTSIFYFVVIEQLFLWDLRVLWILLIVLIGYVGIRTGYNVSNQKLSKFAILLLVVLIISLIIYLLISFNSSTVFQHYNYFYMFLFLCSIFSVLKTALSRVKNRFFYIVTRTVAFSILAGVSIPTLYFWTNMHFDLGFPGCVIVFASLTLAIPFLIGSGLLQYTYFSFSIFRRRSIVIFFLNFVIAAIGAVCVYYISTFVETINKMILYYSTFGILLMILLDIKRYLRRGMSRFEDKEKNKFVKSLQRIAERVTSADHLSESVNLSIKMEEIFSEIITLTDASFLILNLFENSIDDTCANLHGYVELLPEESALMRFFEMNKTIIIQYSLIRSAPLEDNVYRFLEERNIIMAIPIFRDKEAKGALLIGEKAEGEFYSSDEMSYLDIVSSQLYQLIENDRLFRDYLDKKRYEEELDVASYVQLRLFPKTVPERSGLNINFYNRPYFKVMGDYFDFITIDKNRTAIIIGDISGHGLSAAMILSVISSIAHLMLKEKKSIDETVEEMNHFLSKRYEGIELITLFIGIYNKKTRQLEYINAGHLAPIHIKRGNGQLTFLEGRSKILGAVPDSKYSLSKIILQQKDELILYTDGLVEIHNEGTDEGFVEENLLDTISKNIDLDVEGKLNSIIKNMNEFQNGSINDDITLIGVEVL